MSDVKENALAPQWATTSGDAWSRRWRDTDKGLSGLAPDLLAAIASRAPTGPFRAFDVGCGPGSTSIAVAEACPQAEIVACDISPALVRLAQERTAEVPRIRVLLGDAEALAPNEGPFDLVFSRHGVMFFADPVRALRAIREATNAGGFMVFSCFRDWDLNPWAAELASAVAGRIVPRPGREPGGFAFADPDYVRELLIGSGWAKAEPQTVDFQYVAAGGEDAVEHALSYLSEIGPASRILETLPESEKPVALERMRGALERHFDGAAVSFPAAAWIWVAEAPPS